MRLWSLPPEWIDSKGLLACWRESLLALAVLEGKTKGYKNHPQLNRFKKHHEPIQVLCNYLHTLVEEADKRGYNFNKNKIPLPFDETLKIPVNSKQLDYEFQFLRSKVLGRNFDEWKWGSYNMTNSCNPIFTVVYGEIEDWEKVK